MPKPYAKNPLTYVQQLDRLEERGLVVASRENALNFLNHVSYYRFSAYLFPFRTPTNRYIAGTTFDGAVRLYESDRLLRLAVLDGIERVEISLRTALTYHMSHRYGAFGHADATLFRSGFRHAEWLAHLEEEAARSRESFIEHFQATYDGFPRLPLWMATEVMSFGTLSKLYSGMKGKEDQSPIASIYDVHPTVLHSWLHTLSVVRNICAHHSRLWNREFAISPTVPQKDARWAGVNHKRIWGILLVLRWMQAKTGNGEDWQQSVAGCLRPFTDTPGNLPSMGLPGNWQEHPLWVNP